MIVFDSQTGEIINAPTPVDVPSFAAPQMEDELLAIRRSNALYDFSTVLGLFLTLSDLFSENKR